MDKTICLRILFIKVQSINKTLICYIAGVKREIPLEEIEGAAEKSHPEFFVPPWLTPLRLCAPGTPPSTRNLPSGYRGGEYDIDPFQSDVVLPRLPLLSLPAAPWPTGSQPSS